MHKAESGRLQRLSMHQRRTCVYALQKQCGKRGRPRVKWLPLHICLARAREIQFHWGADVNLTLLTTVASHS